MPETVRLSVNLPGDAMQELRDYALIKGVSQTETVRRGIAVLAYVDAVQRRGAAVNVVEPDGSAKEVQFLI